MQKTKPIIISILAVLLVSSMLSVVNAQDTPTTPQTSDDSVTSSIAPDQPQSSPVEGNQSAPGVGDLAPIYEHNGEPAFGITPKEDNPNPSGEQQAQLYAGADNEVNNASQDNTGITIAIGAVLAISVGAIGIICFRKQP